LCELEGEEGEQARVTKENLLACGHAICKEHIAQLPKPECPICRAPIKGRLVTEEVAREVEERQRHQRELNELANTLVARAIAQNPRYEYDERARENLYGRIYTRVRNEGDEIRATADAIIAFEIEDNPILENKRLHTQRYLDILLGLLLN
jgi:hypothetical protein